MCNGNFLLSVKCVVDEMIFLLDCLAAYLLLLWENTFICTPVKRTFIHISSAINYKHHIKTLLCFYWNHFLATTQLSTILRLKIENPATHCLTIFATAVQIS